MNSFEASLRALIGPMLEMRPMDVIDVLLVTAMLASAIVWIRQNRAFLVATGILVAGLVYLAARAFGLQLTAWIFQGFFAIFLIIIVVIFQEELRQLFERVALWSLRRNRNAPIGADPRDTLVRSLVDFARDRTGALIVLPGRQPIARHVEGGIPLGGRLSVPLLMSLFDHHSPGHDGAVIIEGERVSRFAVHLPLSKNSKQLGGVGTRHAAALGLAECTDALCVAVSEERGTISVAHDGDLRRVAGPQELNEALTHFLMPVAGGRNRGPTWRRVLLQNWTERGIALVVVLCLWFVLVPGGRLKEAHYPAKVRIVGLPADRALQTVDPPAVDLTLTGPARAFYLFDAGQLTVTVDAALAKVGRRTFPVPGDSVELPRDLRVVGVEPETIKIDLREVTEKAE